MRKYFRLVSFTFLASTILIFFPQTTYAISFDSSFGASGKVITSFGHDSGATNIALQSDGKIITVGNASNGNNLDWALVRYNTDGSFDNSFDIDGKVIQDIGGNDHLASIKIQTDGKIVVGGYTQASGNLQWAIARFNSNGTPDSTFGNNGITISFTGMQSVLTSIEIQSDNKIIAVGYRQNSGQDDVALARYNSADGSLDPTFGSGGTVTTPIGSSNDRGKAVAIQSDGKIVVVGDFDAGGHDEIFLARYNTNGSLDGTFGSGGKVTTPIGSTAGAGAVKIQSDGKILVTGGINFNIANNADTFVARYMPNGNLDTSFGGTGIVAHSFSSGTDGATSMLLQSNGKITLGGFEYTGVLPGLDFALRQYNPDGTLDTSFGNNGSFVTPIGSRDDMIWSIAEQTDGKIIAAGSASNGSYNDWGLVRYQFTESATPPCVLEKFGDSNGNPLRQGDIQWANQAYGGGYYKKPDGTRVFLPFIYYGNSKDTIGNWGCKLTSAVMIINYYAKQQSIIDQNTNEIFQTDPSKLNSWLQQQDNGKGYYNGNAVPTGNPTHWDSAGVALEAVVKYAKENGVKTSYDQTLMQRIDQNGNELESFADFVTRTNATDKVNTSLCALNPVIIGVNNDGHFIDSTGKVISNGIDTWQIHDPLWNGILPGISTLKDKYNNIYNQIDLVSGKNATKHLKVIKYSPIEMFIVDPLGRKEGFDSNTNTFYDALPGASYGTEHLAADDNGGGIVEYGILDIPNPKNGKYKLTVTGTGNGTYGLEFRGTDREANISSAKLTDTIILGETEIYDLQYDPNATVLIVNKEVTFNTLKADLQKFYSQGLIDNKGILQSLMSKVELAENASNSTSQPLGNKLAITMLNSFQSDLNAQRGKHVKEEAYQVLLSDANSLILSLQ